MTSVIRSGSSVYQTSYDLLCRLLRTALVDGVQAGRSSAGGIGSVQFRACATVYGLLLDHPDDIDVLPAFAADSPPGQCKPRPSRGLPPLRRGGRTEITGGRGLQGVDRAPAGQARSLSPGRPPVEFSASLL
ncbi:MAG: hypothetical protein ACRDUV_02900, partial [Pseudonocardiaceae bacterium]